MNKIVLFLGTMLVSLSVDTISELSILKDIAYRGYKINLNKIFKFINKDNNKFSKLLVFVPGVNIINSLIRMKMFGTIKKDLLNGLEDNDLFIKMTEEEFQKFLDNPKSVTALNLSVDYSLKNESNTEVNKPVGFIKISNGNYRQDNNDGTFNDINFRKDDDKIVITSVSGEIAALTEEEQIKELNKIFKCLYKKKVVLEKKSSTTLKKEILLAHREEVLNKRLDDEQTLVLK